MTRRASCSRPVRQVSADAGFPFITQRSGPVMDCDDDSDTVGGSVNCGCAVTCLCVCVCVMQVCVQ